jgi:hypothetical protein
MTRRYFLRTTVQAALLAASAALSTVAFRQTAEAAAGSAGATAGAGGASFLATLSPGHTLLDRWERQGMVYARVAFQGMPYVIKSADGRRWLTLDYAPPSGAYIGRAGNA